MTEKELGKALLTRSAGRIAEDIRRMRMAVNTRGGNGLEAGWAREANEALARRREMGQTYKSTNYSH